jgi:hypothetical protein
MKKYPPSIHQNIVNEGMYDTDVIVKKIISYFQNR